MIRRILAILVCLCTLFPLVACGGGGNATTYDPDNFLPNGTPENPYQIVKEPVTIEIFAPHSAGNPDYDELVMFKYLEKLTNLRFSFTTADTSAYSNRRSAIWSDPNYRPDLFLFNNAIAEQVQFMEKNYNAFVPFNDASYAVKANSTLVKYGENLTVGNLIDQYMPNYKAGLEENFGIDKNVSDATQTATLSDGKMYATLSVNDVSRDLTYKMFINQQWIDNLNDLYSLKLPNASEIDTVEEYLTVLRAFKKYDANDNGDPNDEVPVTSKSLEYLRNFIIQSYGYVSNSMEIKADGSEYVYVPSTEAYRMYLQTINTMWKEGLIDNTTFSITTDAQMAQKGQKGQLGSFVSAAAYIAVGMEYEGQYVTLAPVTSSYYTGEPIQLGFDYFKPDGACIPQTSIYVREVARLLDIMYSDIGKQLISYGVEGENFTWDDEEKTSWTFIVPESFTGTQEDYRATITPNVGSASALYWSKDFVEKMNDEIITELNKMSASYMQYIKIPEPDKYEFTSGEYEKISKIKATLDPQILYMESCFVKGDKGYDPFNDADWANYLASLDKYGYKDLVDIYNSMLDRK